MLYDLYNFFFIALHFIFDTAHNFLVWATSAFLN
jgi:hypothetical protein